MTTARRDQRRDVGCEGGGDGCHWAFGYGSLLADYGHRVGRQPSPSGFLFTLPGWRRLWNIATDNEQRRIWERPDGSRPALYVAFINIEPAEGTAVNGILFPVGDDEALLRMDRRERNYVRRELPVSAPGLPDEVHAWVYIGSDAARRRFERGYAEGRAYVSRWYRERVERGFRRAGPDEWQLFSRSTAAPTVPDAELRRWHDREARPPVPADGADPCSAEPWGGDER